MTRPYPIRSRFRPALTVIAAGLLVLAACGNDGDGDGAELSEADYVAEFSEICVGVSDQIAALDASTVEEGQEAAMEAQDIVEEGVDQLRALVPPDDIADEVDMGIDALAQTGDVFAELTEIDDEDEFVQTGAQIDEFRQEADEALVPLGIECDSSVNDDGGDQGGDEATEE
jgi:hypothetical protein